MKITISTEKINTIELDVSEGFTYHGKAGDQNSFSNKLLKRLEKILPKSHVQESVVNSLGDSLNYIKTSLTEEFLSQTEIELHIPVENKGFFKKVGSLFNSQDAEKKEETNLEPIFTDRRSVLINLDYQKLNSSTYLENLSEKYTKEETYQFMLFHELGHLLDYHYENEKEDNYTTTFYTLREKISRLNFTNTCIVNDQMLKFDNEPEIDAIDYHFIKHLQKMERESYADIACILLKRNFELEKKSNKTVEEINASLLNDIENINSSRVFAYKNSNPAIFLEQNATKILKHVGNLTSFALSDMPELINSLGNKQLTEKEIHHICLSQVEKGMSKYFYCVSENNSDIKRQVNALFCVEIDPLFGIVEYKSQNNYEKTLLGWKDIESIVGQKYISEYNKATENVERSSVTGVEIVIKKVLSGILLNNKQLGKAEIADNIQKIRDSSYIENINEKKKKKV